MLSVMQTQNDLNICQSRPLRDPRTIAAVRAHRRTNAFSFVRTPTTAPYNPLPPVDVFAVAFGLAPDPRVAERVETLFTAEATRILQSVPAAEATSDDQLLDDERGFIYVFHDAADPPNVLKIGRTHRDPRKRVAEWERELAPEGGKSLRLLAAYPTVANEFSEHVVQEMLRCQRITNRLNPVSNLELDEFFIVENLLALKLFIRGSLLFIDRFYMYWRARRASRRAER